MARHTSMSRSHASKNTGGPSSHMPMHRQGEGIHTNAASTRSTGQSQPGINNAQSQLGGVYNSPQQPAQGVAGVPPEMMPR